MSEVSNLNEEKAKRTVISNAEDLSDLIMGLSAHNTDPDRPFTGQPHTDQGERGKTEVKGIRFRDLADCLIRAYARSSGDSDWNKKADDNTLTYNDAYKIDFDQIDPIAVVQNLTCEVEKMMEVFPNLPKHHSSPTETTGEK